MDAIDTSVELPRGRPSGWSDDLNQPEVALRIQLSALQLQSYDLLDSTHESGRSTTSAYDDYQFGAMRSADRGATRLPFSRRAVSVRADAIPSRRALTGLRI